MPCYIKYVFKRMSAHYFFSLSGPRATYTKRINAESFFFMFLSNLRVKSPITKKMENNIFEGMT